MDEGLQKMPYKFINSFDKVTFFLLIFQAMTYKRFCVDTVGERESSAGIIVSRFIEIGRLHP